MIIRVAAAVLALATTVYGACNCPTSSNRSSGTYQIQTPFDPDNGYMDCVPAAMQCNYTIGTGDPARGIGHFGVIEFTDPDGVLTISLQDPGYKTFTLDVNNYAGQNSSLNAYQPATATTTVTMVWSKNATTVHAVIYGYPLPISQPVVTTAATAMPTPVTVSDGPSPAGLLGVDLAIVVDLASKNTDTFNNMITFIKSAVGKLTMLDDPDVPYGARLVLQTMTQTNRPNNFGDPWNMDIKYFNDQIGVFRPTASQSVWEGPLAAALRDNNAFFGNTSVNSKTRANVQRTYAIFTQGPPTDIDGAVKDLFAMLQDADVHLVIYDFGSGADSAKFKQYVGVIPNVDYVLFNSDEPDSFFQKYLLSSDANSNFGCSDGLTQTLQIDPSNPLTYSWPPAYDVKKTRYCNNQNSKLTLQAAGKAAICISIVDDYELETDKDFVKFVDGQGNLRVSLTGMGVSGSKFRLTGASTTITFTSNEYNVFHGIKFTATSTDTDTCP